jgi:sugar phosphate isomerase/epimerase
VYTRRQFGKAALAALPVPLIAAKIDSTVHGVRIGIHTYSFSVLPYQGILDVVIRSMVDTGIGVCVLLDQQIEPGDLWEQIRPAPGAGGRGPTDTQTRAREKLAQWRVSVSLDHFKGIREKFESAGIEIYGLGATLNPNPSDQELHRMFEAARTLGAKTVNLAGSLSLARRLAPIAEQHRMMVGLQGRPNRNATDPDQIAKPENYDEALSLSKSFRLGFDIGDATGAGFDALKFVQDHRDRIESIYLKDRRKDRATVPWGQGDTPIRQTLQWIRDGKHPILALVDCDYPTESNRPADVKKCFAYAKAALE